MPAGPGAPVGRFYTRSVAREGRPSSTADPGDLARPEDVRQLVAALARLTRARLSQLLGGTAGAELGPRVAEELVQGTLWLVLEGAEARTSETLPVEDLFQEGSAGLVTVVHGLDPRHPLSAAEFLARVRQAVAQVMDSLVADEQEARIEDLRWAADAERLFAAEAELRRSSTAVPTAVELAAHLNWPPARVAQLRQAVDEARSQHDLELMDILAEIDEP